MAGLLGGGSAANAYVTTKYTGIQLQTSARGLPLPVGWGLNRWSVNLIWYNDFKATPVDGKGGKGGGKGSNTYSYTAAVMLALGEGPIDGIGKVWVDNGTSTLGSLNLGLAYGTENQTPDPWIEDNYPSQALPYAYTAYLFSNLYSLGESASLPSHNFEVYAKFNGTMPGTHDANLGDIIPDMITNGQYGLDPGATYLDAGSLAQFKTYQQAQGIFVSPYISRQEKGTSILQRWLQLANSWGFYSGVVVKFVPLGDVAITANGVTYTPRNAPVVDFTYDDLLLDGESTLEVDIVDPWTGYNHVEVDISDRSQNYNSNPVYWQDQASIDQFGQLQSQIISASEVCTDSVGYIIAQLIGKRSVYIRRLPKFKTVNPIACLLEPGDIITLTIPDVGYNKYPIRITDIKEEENFQIGIDAEEFPYGVGQATLYQPQPGTGTGIPNMDQDPGDVNTPLIFEPPTSITGGVPQIWAGASGGPDWGGAQVYASPDGTNYVPIGSIERPTAQGTLTASLPLGSDPDLTNRIMLDMGESGQIISTAATQQMADAYQTLGIVDDELLAYGTVSLTGTNAYTLNYLRRGAYETNVGSHASGSQFYGINPAALLQYTYPRNYTGDTVYLKFCSFNLFGGEVQSIADVTAYPYTIKGSAYTIAPPTSVGLAVVYIGSTLNMAVSWGTSIGPNLANYNVEFSQNDGATWPFSMAASAAANTAYLNNVTPSTDYIARVQAVSSNGATSNWVTSAVVNSGSAPSTVPSAPTGLTGTVTSSSNVQLNWTAPTDTTITSELLYRATNSTTFSAATLIDTFTLPAASFLDTGVVVGNSYTYWLIYVNSAGDSPLSSSVTETITTSKKIVTSNGTTVTSGGAIVLQG